MGRLGGGGAGSSWPSLSAACVGGARVWGECVMCVRWEDGSASGCACVCDVRARTCVCVGVRCSDHLGCLREVGRHGGLGEQQQGTRR